MSCHTASDQLYKTVNRNMPFHLLQNAILSSAKWLFIDHEMAFYLLRYGILPHPKYQNRGS
jgi:uncharacterized membrane protein YwaF